MRRMQRLLSCVLLAALLISLLTAPVSAAEKADNTPEEIAWMQKAIVEMAASYLRRTEDTRYDLLLMTPQNRYTGPMRVTTHDTLGSFAPDNLMYSNCSQFAYTLYYDVFRQGIVGQNGRRSVVSNLFGNSKVGEPDVVLKLGGKDGMTDREAFITQAKELLQPGDVINSVNTVDDKNHTMVYVGDYKGDGKPYVIHSSGGPCGHMGDSHVVTIKEGTWDLFFGTGMFGAMNPEINISIVRPLAVIDYSSMTPEGRARLQRPGLDIIRQGSVWQYMDVTQGQEVEVTLTVRNSGKTAMESLAVSDPAPVGGEIVASSLSEGGTIVDGGASWTLDLPAGQEKKLTYRVKVTAPVGGELRLDAGLVDGAIPTRNMVWYVGGTPVDAAPLEALLKNPQVEGLTENTHIMELDFANVFYKNVLGVDLNLPKTLNEVIDGMFDKVKVSGTDAGGGKMLQPKAYDDMTPEAKKVRDMIIPDHLTGYMVNLGGDPDTSRPLNRVMTYFPEAYRPGDIFIMLNGVTAMTVRSADNVDVAIYLGHNQLAVANEDGTGIRIAQFADLIYNTEHTNIMLTLRPSCLFPDTLTARLYPETVPEAPAEPEAPARPEAPAEKRSPVVLIAIVTGGVLAGAVLGLVLKKKKQ